MGAQEINHEFLCEDLKFLGYGDHLNMLVKMAMAAAKTQFDVGFPCQAEGLPMQAILFFEKKDPEGFFFLTGHRLILRDRSHHFAIVKGRGVTLKEGYHLLCGRAVFKELRGRNGQKHQAWIQLDLNKGDGHGFKMNIYHESYGFDLQAELEKNSGFVSLDASLRAKIQKVLESGDYIDTYLREDGELKLVRMWADPTKKMVHIV
ncbi:MAG TPA: hypothetical protein VKR32_20160 [Puia sp.]|nr:hypothetical protein [Puia sp.]